MCGIAGVLGSGRLSPTEQDALVREMVGTMLHRGPDDCGVEQHGAATLGHRRLSILDLSSAGHQPMRSTDERLVISYNGEVYNFRELAAELERSGAVFRSSSDTEVVVEALRQWGADAFRRFDGMFAIALWDRDRRELTLARDRAGIKPLYYTVTPTAVLFASEIKALWRAAPRSGGGVLNDQALTDIVLTGSVYGRETMFRGIHAVRAGERIVFSVEAWNGRSEFFARVVDEVDPDEYERIACTPDAELVRRLDTLLSTSVERHMASDAKVGVLCSGGVDSSLITALSVRGRPDLGLYHATFAGPGNEQPYAEAVAGRLGTRLRLAEMTRDFYLGHMVSAVWQMDAPSYHANDISLYSVCKLAHEDGCKVLLSGEGADELFGGYSWHLGQVRALRLARRLGRIRRLHRRAGGILQKAVDAWGTGLSAGADRLWLIGAPNQSTRSIALAAQGASARGARWQDWQEARSAYGFVHDADHGAVLAHMLTNVEGHLDTILWRTDRLGMMASVENRVPMLANDLIRFGVNLPVRDKIRRDRTKWLLKQVALRYLPRQVITRPKAGFPVPWTAYLSGDVRSAWRGGFVSESFGMDADAVEAWASSESALRWRLLNLEIWGRLFAWGQELGAVTEWFAGATGSRPAEIAD